MSFAERLKALRKRKGYSQTELAELIDVHYTQISRYERSETIPTRK
ncbi:MAG: helix-turn-helix transcriptional regulator [Saprospiraceae bacterium]|nr:helix-turn-helix transcriptional regulator [Saprospiraceae bacterium]